MALGSRATTVAAPYVVSTTEDWDGNDGAWSTFSISVGTPLQDFRVLISTLGHETWVVAPDGCSSSDPSGCAQSRGAEPYNGAASSGFLTNQSSTWELIGLYDLGLETSLNYSGNGQYGYDTVSLGTSQDSSAIELEHQVVAGIADKDYFMGLLGLNTLSSSFTSVSQPVTSLFYNLKQQNKIPSLSYGYTAGAEYRFKKVPGSLILGGYDQSRFDTTDFSFTFASDNARALIVGVQSIVASDSLLGVASMTTSGHFSLIDSTVPHIWLPEDVCARFESAFGLTYDPTTDLYLVNDTMHDKLLDISPTITLKLGNSIYTSDTNSTNIELPYAAFDLQASWPYYTNATNYFPIRRAANDSQYTIGRTLLQEAYLVVDHERRNFSIAQTIFSDPLPDQQIVAISSTSVNNTISESEEGGSSGLSTGAKAGIGIGAAATVILALVGLAIWCRRKKRRHVQLPDTQPFEPQENKPYVEDAAGLAEVGGVPLVEMGVPKETPKPPPTPPPQELPGRRDEVAAYELAGAFPPLAYEMEDTGFDPTRVAKRGGEATR